MQSGQAPVDHDDESRGNTQSALDSVDEAQLRSRLLWTANECLKHLEEFTHDMEALRQEFHRSSPPDIVAQ